MSWLWWTASAISALIAGYLFARHAIWEDDDENLSDMDGVDWLFFIPLLFIVMGIAFFMWLGILILGAVAGGGWLFIQAAKPGRIKPPRIKRRTRRNIQTEIDRLERELAEMDGT